MRLLFVTPYVPSGLRIRPLAFLRELARRGHEVTLVCLVQPAWEARYLHEVSPYCQAVYPVSLDRWEPYWRTLASLPGKEPLSVAYCRTEALAGQVRRLIETESFDLIHTEFLRAAPATAHLEGIPRVFDAVDSLALAYRRSLSAPHVSVVQRLVSLVEWLKLRGYEPGILKHFDRTLVSSPRDRAVLENHTTSNVTVIPNGVDLDYFCDHGGAREPNTLVFLGKMSYYVNVASVLWFYKEVFSRIRQERPEVRLKIVGRSPVPRIQALAADPAVEVTGEVPDVRPYLSAATAAICPMVSGSGIQNKMLEAMAMGLPVVATPLAVQAIEVVHEQEVMVAEEAPAFADSVLELLGSDELRDRLSKQGRQYVERQHDWTCIGERLENVFRELVSTLETRGRS